MKKVWFSILGLLICTILFADEINKCYKIDKSTQPVTIWVTEGCKDTLYVKEIVDSVQPGKTVYGDDYRDDYRDKDGNLKSDFNTLKSRFITDNKRCTIAQWNNKKMFVIVNSSDTNNVYAVYHTKWDSSNRIEFKFKLKYEEVAAPGVEKPAPVTIEMKPEEHKIPEKPDKAISGEIVVIFIWIAMLSFALVVLTYIMHKQKNERKRRLLIIGNIQKEITELRNKIITQEQVNESVQKAFEEQRKMTPSQNSNTSPSAIVTTTPKTPTPKVTPTPDTEINPMLNTDQVDCNWENGFFIMQPNDKPIFRIYQKENIFYYTLVESIKSSMPSMLISTENFIVVNKRTSDLPKGVEIVKEGIVVPSGNNQYRVDPNNKLIINVI